MKPKGPNVSVYLYPTELAALGVRPLGQAPGGWVVQIARRYLADTRALEGTAPQGVGSPKKLVVRLPPDVQQGLEARHPGQPLAPVLRTLILLAAGYSFTIPQPADGASFLQVQATIPGDLEGYYEGPELDEAIAAALRTGALPRSDDRLAWVQIPAELVPALDRLRGDLTPTAYLSKVFQDIRAMSRANQRADPVRPQVVIADPRPFQHWLTASAGQPWPDGTIIAYGPLEDAYADEFARRAAQGDQFFWVVCPRIAAGDDPLDPVGPCGTFFRSVALAAEQSGVRCWLRCASLMLASDLLGIVEVVMSPVGTTTA